MKRTREQRGQGHDAGLPGQGLRRGAARRHPDFNASLDGDTLVLKKYFHIGFAADTPNGLVVPVIRDAERKGLLEIAQEMGAPSTKAREGKLAPADMQGGCFSISSLGGIGGTILHPHHQCARGRDPGGVPGAEATGLGWRAVVPRLVLPLSLSYDHGHRRRGRRAVHDVSGVPPGRLPAGVALAVRRRCRRPCHRLRCNREGKSGWRCRGQIDPSQCLGYFGHKGRLKPCRITPCPPRSTKQ